jgi:hypothetical protein
LETATNIPLPYVTEVQLLSAAEVRDVHKVPGSTASVEVMVMLDVDEHPFASVAVTVYVPIVVMLAVADEPKLLLHE